MSSGRSSRAFWQMRHLYRVSVALCFRRRRETPGPVLERDMCTDFILASRPQSYTNHTFCCEQTENQDLIVRQKATFVITTKPHLDLDFHLQRQREALTRAEYRQWDCLSTSDQRVD